MTLNSRQELTEKLKDKEFRDSFVSARVDTTLAFQTRALRQKNGWSQAELARRLGTSQNAVSRLESPNYGRAAISTLKKVASVFDVALMARYVRFSALLNDVLAMSAQSVIVDSFAEDAGFQPCTVPAAATTLRVNQIFGGVSAFYLTDFVESGTQRLSGESMDQYAVFISNQSTGVNTAAGGYDGNRPTDPTPTNTLV